GDPGAAGFGKGGFDFENNPGLGIGLSGLRTHHLKHPGEVPLILVLFFGEFVLEVIIPVGQAESALRKLESVKLAVFWIGRHIGAEKGWYAAGMKVAEQFKERFG